jgi:hypothetical protein
VVSPSPEKKAGTEIDADTAAVADAPPGAAGETTHARTEAEAVKETATPPPSAADAPAGGIYAQRARPFTEEKVRELESGLKPLESLPPPPHATPPEEEGSRESKESDK